MDFTLATIPSPPTIGDPAAAWIAIAVGVLAVVYVVYVRPLRKKKQSDPLDRGAAHGTLSQRRAVERDMSNLLVELSEMARQMTAQLDTRAAKLELLIREADEKIAVLRGLESANGHSDDGRVSAEQPTSSVAAALEGVIMEARAPIRPSFAEPPLDPRHVRIYDMADEGHTPQEIARQLDRPSGEIELILALRDGGHA